MLAHRKLAVIGGFAVAAVAAGSAGAFALTRLCHSPAGVTHITVDQAIAAAFGHLHYYNPEFSGWRVVSTRYQDGGTRVDFPLGQGSMTGSGAPFHVWVIGLVAPPQRTWAVVQAALAIDGRSGKVDGGGMNTRNLIPGEGSSGSATPAPSPSTVTPSAAAMSVRQEVVGARPVLLPAAIPADWTATVNYVNAGSFAVTYRDPASSKQVTLAIEEPNPPAPGIHGSQKNGGFRGDRHSLYQVDDARDPRSHRFQLWIEPGTWTVEPPRGGIPYLLFAYGVTDGEFFAIADSLVDR